MVTIQFTVYKSKRKNNQLTIIKVIFSPRPRPSKYGILYTVGLVVPSKYV